MKRHILAVVFGLCGVLLGLVTWHLWNDHLLVDAIRADIARQQAAGSQSVEE